MFLKNFIFSGDGNRKSLTTCQWKHISKPINECGLGICLLEEFNISGLYRRAWELVVGEKIWMSFVHAGFMKNNMFLNYYKLSSLWPGLKQVMPSPQQDLAWKISLDSQCNLWINDWLLKGSLITKAQILQHLLSTKDVKLNNFIVNGFWFFQLY